MAAEQVYIEMRHESEMVGSWTIPSRRVCLGAYKSKDGALRAIGEDIEELDSLYDESDYDIIPTTLED